MPESRKSDISGNGGALKPRAGMPGTGKSRFFSWERKFVLRNFSGNFVEDLQSSKKAGKALDKQFQSAIMSSRSIKVQLINNPVSGCISLEV